MITIIKHVYSGNAQTHSQKRGNAVVFTLGSSRRHSHKSGKHSHNTREASGDKGQQSITTAAKKAIPFNDAYIGVFFNQAWLITSYDILPPAILWRTWKKKVERRSSSCKQVSAALVACGRLACRKMIGDMHVHQNTSNVHAHHATVENISAVERHPVKNKNTRQKLLENIREFSKYFSAAALYAPYPT